MFTVRWPEIEGAGIHLVIFPTTVLIGQIIVIPRHIGLRLYIRCTCDVFLTFWSGCRPNPHYHHAMGTFLNPKTDGCFPIWATLHGRKTRIYIFLNLSELSIFVPCVFKNNFSKMSQRLSAKTVLFLAFLEICYNHLSIIL